jgi:glycerophosphoryl diester phosphodiesterase
VGAQFIGTNLGEENDGLSPLFSEEIRSAGLKCNVYSFNTNEQMEKYFGTGAGSNAEPIVDGMITNRSDLTIDFYYSA